MRHWINFAPAAAFFAAYLAFDNFQDATAVLMAAVVLQIILLKVLRLPVQPTEWAVAGLILVFGSATLLLQDTIYLQIKTTVINWSFALALLLADFAFGRNLARVLLGNFFKASSVLWRRVSCVLAAMFAFLGTVNLVVVFNFSEQTWVWVKTFAYPAVTFTVLIGVFVYLAQKGELKDESHQ